MPAKKNIIVILEIDMSPKAQDKLAHIAHDRGSSVDQYVAGCIQSKLEDMIDAPICVSYRIDKEE